MSELGPTFPPLARTRLYEQVAEQISAWIDDNGLAGGRPAPARARARAAPRRQPGHPEPGPRRARGDRRGGGPARRRHVVRSPPDHGASSRRSAPTPTGCPRSSTPATPWRPRSRRCRRAATDDDLARIDDALAEMEADIEAGGRGVEGDERFHGAVTAAAHSLLLARLMDEIGDLIRETRIESLSQPDRPATPSPGTGRSPTPSAPATPRRPRPRCTPTSSWSATWPAARRVVTSLADARGASARVSAPASSPRRSGSRRC